MISSVFIVQSVPAVPLKLRFVFPPFVEAVAQSVNWNVIELPFVTVPDGVFAVGVVSREKEK